MVPHGLFDDGLGFGAHYAANTVAGFIWPWRDVRLSLGPALGAALLADGL
jgi:hypothetical protein